MHTELQDDAEEVADLEDNADTLDEETSDEDEDGEEDEEEEDAESDEEDAEEPNSALTELLNSDEVSDDQRAMYESLLQEAISLATVQAREVATSAAKTESALAYEDVIKQVKQEVKEQAQRDAMEAAGDMTRTEVLTQMANEESTRHLVMGPAAEEEGVAITLEEEGEDEQDESESDEEEADGVSSDDEEDKETAGSDEF